jgi:hypothetical protein
MDGHERLQELSCFTLDIVVIVKALSLIVLKSALKMVRSLHQGTLENAELRTEDALQQKRLTGAVPADEHRAPRRQLQLDNGP